MFLQLASKSGWPFQTCTRKLSKALCSLILWKKCSIANTIFYLNSHCFCFSGFYIHHIDNIISLRKLELNFRPPEEFFWNLKLCSTDAIETMCVTLNSQSEQSAASRDTFTFGSKSSTLPKTAVPDIDKSSLKRKNSKKLKGKTKGSPITPAPGMFGCFGLKVFRKKKDKTK